MTMVYDDQKEYVTGDVSFFPNPSLLPPTWIRCQGQSLSADEYPELFLAIGYTFGGSGVTFLLPTIVDFIRCLNDSGSGIDSERGEFTVQEDDVENHNHGNVTFGNAGSHFHSGYQYWQMFGNTSSTTGGGSQLSNVNTRDTTQSGGMNGNHIHSLEVSPNTGTETRPSAMTACLAVFIGGKRNISYVEGI